MLVDASKYKVNQIKCRLKMSQCSGSRQQAAAGSRQQAATEELYATLPKAGAMLTINIEPTCAFEIEMAS